MASAPRSSTERSPRATPSSSPRAARRAPARPGRAVAERGVSSRAAVVDTEGIEKVYTMGDVKVHALRGVSLRIDPGEFIAVMGASGSGKSTFMNLVGCLDKPTSGAYLLNGKDVSRFSRDQLAGVRGREIGFVFQGF